MPVKYVAIGAAVLIVIAAVYAYVSYSSGNAGQLPESADENVTVENQGTGADSASGRLFIGSMADLIGRGGNWKCTFDGTTQISNSTGAVYVSGQKIRGDFSNVIAETNQKVDSHIVEDGGYVYVWTSLSPQGLKAETTLGTEDATTKFSDQGVDINQQYEYDCKSWAVDDTMFALPQNITFVE